jgi:hypothetical protein
MQIPASNPQGELMTRLIASLALLAACATPVLADIPPQKSKCSTSEEDGFFLAACLLIAATMLALRALRRGTLGRA